MQSESLGKLSLFHFIITGDTFLLLSCNCAVFSAVFQLGWEMVQKKLGTVGTIWHRRYKIGHSLERERPSV